jgi:hypothetical protein
MSSFNNDDGASFKERISKPNSFEGHLNAIS